MRNYFTFAGRDSREFGVYISGQGTFSAPEKAYTFYDVPGRSGAIIGNDHRLANIEVSYECFIYTNFNENIAAFRTFLLSLNGYQRLEDSYHPDEFRYAVYVGPFDPEVTSKNDAGSFTLTFNCKPQRYLLSGDASYTWVPGGDQGITGIDLFVYEPRLDQSVLKWSYNKHDYYNVNWLWDPASSALVCSCYLSDWPKMMIDGQEEYVFKSFRPTGTYLLYRLSDFEWDLIAGTVTVNSIVLYPGEMSNWSYWEDHAAYTYKYNLADHPSGLLGDLSPIGIDKILGCNYFRPVDTVAELDDYDFAICYESPYLYIKNKYTSTLSIFKNYMQYSASNLSYDIKLTQPIVYTQAPQYTPDYPTPTFRMSFSADDLDHFLTLSGGEKGYFTIKYTGSDSMSNPTLFPSEPLIRVYGTGDFEMDGVVVTITTCNSYTDIDCELMDCYEGSTNRNNAVSFSTYDFPKLQPGDNEITITTGISAVEIIPRWWRV